MTGGFSVTIEDVAASAATFSRLATRSLAELDHAAGVLSATAGMGGDDAVLALWRERYDGLASAVWAVCGTVTATLSDIATKLAETGNSYLEADRASGGDALGGIPPPARLGPRPPPPPSSSGTTGPGVPPEVAAYWPGGDPGMLRYAAGGWDSLATALEDAALDADSAFRSLLDANHGAAFSAMATYWDLRFRPCGAMPLFNAGPVAARTLGLACARLAAVVETTRAEVCRTASDASDALSGLDVPAHLLARFTRGATDAVLVVGKAALTSKFLDAYRDRYLADLERLVTDLLDLDRAHLVGLATPVTPQAAVEVALADVGDVVGLGLAGSAWDHVVGEAPGPDAVHLTEERAAYVLDGNGLGGGGHAPHTGLPGKTEFPAAWSDDEILRAVVAVARAPSAAPEMQGSGWWRAEGHVNGVLIRVVLDQDGRIHTAHPVSGPGVIHNPP